MGGRWENDVMVPVVTKEPSMSRQQIQHHEREAKRKSNYNPLLSPGDGSSVLPSLLSASSSGFPYDSSSDLQTQGPVVQCAKPAGEGGEHEHRKEEENKEEEEKDSGGGKGSDSDSGDE